MRRFFWWVGLVLLPLLASVHSDKSYSLEGREALLHNNLHICVCVCVCVCVYERVRVCVFCSVGYSLFTPLFLKNVCRNAIGTRGF